MLSVSAAFDAPADDVRLSPAGNAWEAAVRLDRMLALVSVSLQGRELFRNVQETFNGLPFSGALMNAGKNGRKGGAAVVETGGYFPFGGQIRIEHQAVFAANHARFRMDIAWPARTEIRRHLETGSLFLPGPWTRFFCIPPAQHLVEGKAPAWTAVPAAPKTGDAAAATLMIAHWHRPPLVLLFERPDGTRLELGTGSDLWRWEQALGAGPESGSYKLLLEADGIRFVREAAMCCTPFQPEARDYRLTWYAAWSERGAFAAENGTGKAPDGKPGEPPPALLAPDGSFDADVAAGAAEITLDFTRLRLQPHWCRCASPADYALGQRGAPCWEEGGVQKAVRSVIRKLAAARPQGGRLRMRGVLPGICRDPAHLGKKSGGRELPHWDINSILDFAEWTRRQLGPAWEIIPDRALPAPWNELPSLAGLFTPSGFEAPEPEAVTDADGD